MAETIFSNGDSSDNYANKKALYLSFFHLASKKEVNFKAFVTSYSETLSTEWNLEQVFGRNDPIATFKSTARRISVSWVIPAASLDEAKVNLGRCNLLSQFMYPAYTNLDGDASTLSKPPLMRIRFANLIKNSSLGDDAGARVSGLLSAVNAITITPSFDDTSGFFDPGQGKLFPKLITVNLDFTALHEHQLGWGTSSGFESQELQDFPFGNAVVPRPGNSPEARVISPAANGASSGDVDDSVAPPNGTPAQRSSEESERVNAETEEEALLLTDGAGAGGMAQPSDRGWLRPRSGTTG